MTEKETNIPDKSDAKAYEQYMTENVTRYFPRRVTMPQFSEEELNGPYSADLKYAVLRRDNLEESARKYLRDEKERTSVVTWSSVILAAICGVMYLQANRFAQYESASWYTALAIVSFLACIISMSVALGRVLDNGMVGAVGGIILTIVYANVVEKPLSFPVVLVACAGMIVYSSISLASLKTRQAKKSEELQEAVMAASDKMFEAFDARLVLRVAHDILKGVSTEELIDAQGFFSSELSRAREDIADWKIARERWQISLVPIWKSGEKKMRSYAQELADGDNEFIKHVWDDELFRSENEEKLSYIYAPLGDDTEEANKMIRSGALNYSGAAMLRLSYNHMKGCGVPADPGMATVWAEIAAMATTAEDDPVLKYESLNQLAGCYAQDSPDFPKSAEHYWDAVTASAQLGSKRAQEELAKAGRKY
ncbi:MAG: hypothetical protein J5822_03150 [Eubacteriaceae bacterium]|nr:hypothetical protein [Eubacteriaceae bacterium]